MALLKIAPSLQIKYLFLIELKSNLSASYYDPFLDSHWHRNGCPYVHCSFFEKEEELWEDNEDVGSLAKCRLLPLD
jgi:hypothetical protein